MAWLWNSQSIKYRKNGATKSLIHLSDPVNDLDSNIRDEVKYLCVYKKGVTSTASNMYKIPMIEETRNGDWYLAIRSDMRVRLNGKTYIPFLNAGIIRLSFNISFDVIHSDSYQTWLGCQVSLNSNGCWLPIRLPAETIIGVQCVLDRGTVKSNYFTIPAGNFSNINNSDVFFSWCTRDITGKENVYSSNYRIVMYVATGTYNSKSFSKTIFDKSDSPKGDFTEIVRLSDFD